MSRVHLDYNATTPMRDEARDVLIAMIEEGLANPSSVHASGQRARMVVDEARERVAAALGVPEDAVIFTSGGTESNNLAILGSLRASAGPSRLITSPVEHAAVREVAQHLESNGLAEVIWLPVNHEGRPDLDRLAEAAQLGPATVSLMAANNEIGTITPFEAVQERIGGLPGVVYHSDAVQMLGKAPIDLDGVDLASFSAHKVGGPVGVGILARREGVQVTPQVFGGSQEAALRPGTENVAAIAAAACAIELATLESAAFAERTHRLSTQLWEELKRRVPDLRLNGPQLDNAGRLPNTLNVSPKLTDARTLVARLDMAGLEASAGSACASGSIEPSHVLAALGISAEQAAAGIRLSLGRTTTTDDIHSAVDKIWRTLGEAP